MARVHYFQRYSSVENTVTNNTLQLLGRIYASAPQKAAVFINELVGTDDPVQIGLEINQQQRGLESVPDGVISQQGFKILIETKVDSPVNVEQLVRHAGNFTGEGHKILMLLTKQPIGSLMASIQEALAAAARDVVFCSVTFEDVIGALPGLFQDYEYEMVELVRDYVEYCWEAGLVDRSRYLLRIVPCGQSLEINRKHGIYFHPSDRAYSTHRFTGIYKDKCVQAMWENDSVFDVTLIDGKLEKELVSGRNTDRYDEGLRGIIEDAYKECGYQIATGYRFFCGVPHGTAFAKSSRYGIMGQRYIDMLETVGEYSDVEDLASKLKSASWE